jgi:hypothetical protein
LLLLTTIAAVVFLLWRPPRIETCYEPLAAAGKTTLAGPFLPNLAEHVFAVPQGHANGRRKSLGAIVVS